MTHRTLIRDNGERGIALVITIFLMATLSALAVSLMFLSQTETSASRNYKMMSEVRYGGEAGVHKAINYLINDYTPSSTSDFDLTKSPVTCTTTACSHHTTTTCDASTLALAQSTGCIVLAPSGSNYPDSTVVSAFTSAVQGTLTLGSGSVNPGNASVNYSAYAILMSMQTVDVYGGTPKTAQSWKIVGTGSVSGTVPASLEVSAMLEQDVVDATTYAVYATSGICGAITIGGNASTNSYNSATASNPPVSSDFSNSGGNVGTNGNLNIGNHAAAQLGGSLYTPRSGAGTCSSSSPDAVSGSGSATVSGSMVHLAQSVSYPTPTIPPAGAPAIPSSGSTTITTSSCISGLLGSIGVTNWGCTVSGSTLKISPLVSCVAPCYLTLGNVTVGASTTLEVDGGGSAVMDVNSFKLGSNAVFNPGTSPSTTITMNIAGQSLGSTLPLDLTGGGNVNTNTYDPARLQFLYAGTGEIDVVGNNTVAATIYAPNAAMKATGSGTVFGSILSSTYTDQGGATLHYDTNLQKKFKTLGNYVMTSFSWRKY